MTQTAWTSSRHNTNGSLHDDSPKAAVKPPAGQKKKTVTMRRNR